MIISRRTCVCTLGEYLPGHYDWLGLVTQPAALEKIDILTRGLVQQTVIGAGCRHILYI